MGGKLLELMDQVNELNHAGRQEPSIEGQSFGIADLGGFVAVGISPKTEDELIKRRDFVHDYFAERGWDINSPTIEQILEVRSQPQWQGTEET